MIDGQDNDDQPPQGERERQRSRSSERVYPHVPVPQEPKIQPMVTPESDEETPVEDFTIVDPHHHQLDQNHQLNKGIAPEEPTDLDHVSENILVHPRMLANNSLLHLLQQNSRIRQL